MKLFNYKDWWNWVYWIFLIWIVSDIIMNLNTLQRWKWGYWSIDLIPATIMLFILFVANTTISNIRLSRRISKLEEVLK